MCKALKVASYFFKLQGDDAGDAISNMKLQKLMYYAQGYYLAIEGVELFKEDFEKWEHGPVIPSLYRLFKKYGSGALPVPDNFDLDMYTRSERTFLNDIYDSFGLYSAWALSKLSHDTDPWRNASYNGIISKSSITKYFKTQLEDN